MKIKYILISCDVLYLFDTYLNPSETKIKFISNSRLRITISYDMLQLELFFFLLQSLYFTANLIKIYYFIPLKKIIHIKIVGFNLDTKRCVMSVA